MKNKAVQTLFCWALSLSISLLPAVRLHAASGCDNEFVAGILFDHLATSLLSTDALTNLSRLNIRELRELDPTAEMESLKVLWQSIQLMRASDAKRTDGIQVAKAQFLEAVSQDKQFMERLKHQMKITSRIRQAELDLSSLNYRFGLSGEDRITTLDLTRDLAKRLESVNFADILQRYLGPSESVMDFITHSAQAIPFRRWMISNLLHPSDEFYTLLRNAILDAQNPNIPMPSLEVFLNYSDDELNQLVQSIYQQINHLPVDIEIPDALIDRLFNQYARQNILSSNVRQISYQFARNIQKIDHIWAASGLEISTFTPRSLRPLIPMLYMARSQIPAANNAQAFIQSLLFYDFITGPPVSIADRLQNPEAFANLVSHLNDLRFGDYLRARTNGLALIPHLSLDTQLIARAARAMGFAIIQLAYLIVASAGDLVPLPHWLLAIMGAYMIGLRQSVTVRP